MKRKPPSLMDLYEAARDWRKADEEWWDWCLGSGTSGEHQSKLYHRLADAEKNLVKITGRAPLVDG